MAIASLDFEIFASHPLAKSIDRPPLECPIVAGLSIPTPSPTPSEGGFAIIRATFLLIGVLGGELPLAIAAKELKPLADVEPGVDL